jgi:flagellar basal-body rod protein FlgF
MENSIYTGLSRQMVLQNKMDLIANNIANVSTPGYRAQNMLFKEYVANPSASSGKEDPKDPLSMVEDYGQ